MNSQKHEVDLEVQTLSDEERLAIVENERQELYEWFHAFISDKDVKAHLDPSLRIAVRDSMISEITSITKQRRVLMKKIGQNAINI